MLFLPLSDHHDRQSFQCEEPALSDWLKKTARQHQEKRISSPMVAVADETSPVILGYYAYSVAELLTVDLPEIRQKKLPRVIPVFRLGRLARDVNQKGSGLGELLLFDAIDRTSKAAQVVSGVGLVVDAKPAAVEFYLRYGFEQLLDHPLKLFLPY